LGKSEVLFFCTLPKVKKKYDNNDDNEHEDEISNKRLTFSCRGRSCGVLENEESTVTNEQFEAAQDSTGVDPFFFDKG